MSGTDEWINKIWSTHATEYYSCPQRSEALTHVTTQMSLENMTLSARSQTQKATWEGFTCEGFTCEGFHLSRIGECMETEGRSV